MLRIGITGQAGFIGTHLYNYLSLFKDRYTLTSFQDSFFQSSNDLENFVRSCDIIIHLAAVNRHANPEELFETNVALVRTLINALESAEVKPYVIMSSSLQEENNNIYGSSKKEGRLLLTRWAEENSAKFSGLIIPNVFGPFGVPFYNSVISTFSHQIVNGLTPKIEIDAVLKLIYINDLITEIVNLIDQSTTDDKISALIKIEHRAEKKVSDLLTQLYDFKTAYQENGIIPNLIDQFDLALFNTYRSYIPLDSYPIRYKKNSDNRGDFVEIIKCNTPGQTSYSTTKPGVTRGNHFHVRKVERFAVIKGIASIKLRKYGTKEVFEIVIDGSSPGFVDMPIWYTHNITNIGEDDLITLFWINEQFDPDNPDTYYELV